MSKLIVISATSFEASPTLEKLQELNIEYDYEKIGIGPINAARKSEHLDLAGKSVLFIGSCGVFNEKLERKIISTDTIIWSPPSIRNGSAELIDNIEPKIKFENLSKFSKSLDIYTCYCSPAITLDAELRPPSENAIENMELYSIASALNKASNLTILLGITNSVNLNGRHQWKKNHLNIAEKTADLLSLSVIDQII